MVLQRNKFNKLSVSSLSCLPACESQVQKIRETVFYIKSAFCKFCKECNWETEFFEIYRDDWSYFIFIQSNFNINIMLQLHILFRLYYSTTYLIKKRLFSLANACATFCLPSCTSGISSSPFVPSFWLLGMSWSFSIWRSSSCVMLKMFCPRRSNCKMKFCNIQKKIPASKNFTSTFF